MGHENWLCTGVNRRAKYRLVDGNIVSCSFLTYNRTRFVYRMCRRKEAHRSGNKLTLMTDYRRIYIPNATWFFTVNLAERRNNHLLVEKIDSLRMAFRYVKERKPFHINAVVIMPDHLHTIWTLPPEDMDYSIRWNLLKGHFSRSIGKGERISTSRGKRRERGLWQRRFWGHLINNQEDFNRHFDYIHWNPVKHGWAKRVADWPHSSFHQFVAGGIYPATWGYSEEFNIDAGE